MTACVMLQYIEASLGEVHPVECSTPHYDPQPVQNEWWG